MTLHRVRGLPRHRSYLLEYAYPDNALRRMQSSIFPEFTSDKYLRDEYEDDRPHAY